MKERLFCLLLTAAALAARADPLPAVASINLCTDQLLLTLADPAQIRSLSWLSADPNESMLAEQASRYPLNYGTAEEILLSAPEVVLGGAFTSGFTRATLRRLGFEIVTINPANSLEEIERNLRLVGAAIGREAAAELTIVGMRDRVGQIERARGDRRAGGIVVRPGGFTVGGGSLAGELMALAGIDNIAAMNGLDSWGSLSLESLISHRPALLIFTGYRRDAPSLANAIFDHPVFDRLALAIPAATIPAPLWSCGIPASLASAETLVHWLDETRE